MVGFPRKLLAEHENMVLDLRPHWVAILPSILWSIVLLVAVVPRLPGRRRDRRGKRGEREHDRQGDRRGPRAAGLDLASLSSPSFAGASLCSS